MLEEARRAHAEQAWQRAADLFDQAVVTEAADLELAAEAANMAGRGAAEIRYLRRALEKYGTSPDALRCGYWLCKAHAWAGDHAQAGAWQARLTRQAKDDAYVRLLAAEQDLRAGRKEQLLRAARELAGQPTDDHDLRAAVEMVLGIALIENDDIAAGLGHLDDAMVAAVDGVLSARATGMIYCVTIGTCHELHELRRAKEWTAALAGWCAVQPEFTGAYRGLCRIHRVSILTLTGHWDHAAREAALACKQLTTGYGEMLAGAAFYELAELCRLRGAFDDADRSYREALGRGWNVQPGLALLRLAQGRTDAAAAGIRRALDEEATPRRRARLLPAAVEVALARGADASGHAGELRAIATKGDTTALYAVAEMCTGAVKLAGGEDALNHLRHAYELWRDLEARYEAARTRLLIAQACRALGDEDAAAMEHRAGCDELVRLGAAPPVRKHGLTPRELEVIRLIARGHTNREIATRLRLSEKTVARHLSNIFGKLGVGSRTAAAAYAYENGMV
nr:helix-turn-helix transcriptional regulator [uncultured Actinoplanes sp.]